MAINVKFKEKKKYDNSDKLCIWCYKVVLEGHTGPQNEDWGLDFPQGTKIQDPKNYENAPDYELDKDDKGHVVVHKKLPKGTKEFEICFLGPCGESLETEISVESFVRFSDGTYHWSPFEGGGTMLGPAVAAAPSKPNDAAEYLAWYEGTKLSYLLSRASFPSEVQPLSAMTVMYRLEQRVSERGPVGKEAQKSTD